MKFRFVVPYRLYKFSLVDYNSLIDNNTCKFDRRECEGYFSVINLNKYSNQSFREMQKISHLSSSYLSQIEYSNSYDYCLQFDITCTCDNTGEIKSDEISNNEMRRIRK